MDLKDLKHAKAGGPAIGQPVQRLEDQRFLLCSVAYVGDLSSAGMLSA